MNVHIRQHPGTSTTQAAEGLPRRAWTIAEIERMVAAGIIDEGERFELIGGEIVPMSPKGAFHETLKKDLARFWYQRLPDDVDVIPETTFHITERDFRAPDFIFWPRALGIRGLKPDVTLLVVEVSDSSLDYDLGAKAAYYASIGIVDYWVINARTLVTRIHRAPSADGFKSIQGLPFTADLVPLHLASLAVRLADLGLLPAVE